MQITPQNLAAFRRGLRLKFQAGIDANLKKKRLWTPADLASESPATPSAEGTEEIVWFDKIPRLKTWTANKETQNVFVRGLLARHEKFHNLHEIDEVDLERNNARRITAVMNGLSMAAADWRRWLVVDALRNGGATFSGYVGYDGQPAFSTQHPVHPNNAARGVQSNIFAGAVTDANYELAYAQFQDFRGLDGEVLGVYPDVWLVPPKLAKPAARIVTARTAPNGAENVNAGSVRLIEMPELIPPGAAANDPVRETSYLLSTVALSMPIEILIEKDPTANLRFNGQGGDAGLVDGDVVRNEKIVLDTPGRGCAYILAWYLALKWTP